jgi:outer membrane protein TolC
LGVAPGQAVTTVICFTVNAGYSARPSVKNLGLRWRLFDFGRVDAQIAAARGQEAEALAAYRLAVLRATEDVENGFSALVKREAQVGILTQGESSPARARHNSDAADKGGVVSLIEVLDADANLLQVRDAKAQAQTEAARAAIASFRALGGGWDARRAGATARFERPWASDSRSWSRRSTSRAWSPRWC